jgi:hypothetical protein
MSIIAIISVAYMVRNTKQAKSSIAAPKNLTLQEIDDIYDSACRDMDDSKFVIAVKKLNYILGAARDHQRPPILFKLAIAEQDGYRQSLTSTDIRTRHDYKDNSMKHWQMAIDEINKLIANDKYTKYAKGLYEISAKSEYWLAYSGYGADDKIFHYEESLKYASLHGYAKTEFLVQDVALRLTELYSFKMQESYDPANPSSKEYTKWASKLAEIKVYIDTHLPKPEKKNEKRK